MAQTQSELAVALQEFGVNLGQALTDSNDQLMKALNEITLAMQNSGNVTPELEGAVAGMKAAIESGSNNVKAVAQQLDDLNPDNPQP